MLARLCLTSLLLLLGACQNTSVNRDYDSSRDFGAYRSWSWQEPALQYRPDDPRLPMEPAFRSGDAYVVYQLLP